MAWAIAISLVDSISTITIRYNNFGMPCSTPTSFDWVFFLLLFSFRKLYTKENNDRNKLLKKNMLLFLISIYYSMWLKKRYMETRKWKLNDLLLFLSWLVKDELSEKRTICLLSLFCIHYLWMYSLAENYNYIGQLNNWYTRNQFLFIWGIRMRE